jgi:hypothetical protein
MFYRIARLQKCDCFTKQLLQILDQANRVTIEIKTFTCVTKKPDTFLQGIEKFDVETIYFFLGEEGVGVKSSDTHQNVLGKQSHIV